MGSDAVADRPQKILDVTVDRHLDIAEDVLEKGCELEHLLLKLAQLTLGFVENLKNSIL